MRMYGPLKKIKKMTVRVELINPKPPSASASAPAFALKKMKTDCFASIPAPSTPASRDLITAAVFHVASSTPPPRDDLRVALSKAHGILTIKKQTELKTRREQARLKLIDVEKRARAVIEEDKLESFKELEKICGCSVGIGGFPLDWLGLTRKEDVEEKVDS